MLNYNVLSQQEYETTVVDLISSLEREHSTVYQKAQDNATIGYGYTFVRNNNLDLWQAAGISLSDIEIAVLRSIDAATDPATKSEIAGPKVPESNGTNLSMLQYAAVAA